MVKIMSVKKPKGYIVDGVFHTFDEQPYDEFDEDDDMYGDDTW